MGCTYADVAFLVDHFPFVDVALRGKWRVTVVVANAGDYTVTLNGDAYAYTWQAGDNETAVRNGMQAALAPQLLVTASAFGPASLDLQETAPATIETIDAVGPNAGDVTIVQTAPQSNVEHLDLWLEATKCGVNCCYIAPCDQQLYHAALAAHYITTFGNTGPTGQSAGDYEEMRLGPARIRKGNAAANAQDSDLAKTAPGRLVLELRNRYVPRFLCA